MNGNISPGDISNATTCLMDAKSVKVTNSIIAERDTNNPHALNNHLKSLKNRKAISHYQTVESTESTLQSTQTKSKPLALNANSSKQNKRFSNHNENCAVEVHNIEAINYNVSNLAGKFEKLKHNSSIPDHNIRQTHGMCIII